MIEPNNVIEFPMHRTRRPVTILVPNFFDWYFMCLATTVALGVWWWRQS